MSTEDTCCTIVPYFRVADGRLAESWGVEDTLGWFRQLGGMPELP